MDAPHLEDPQDQPVSMSWQDGQIFSSSEHRGAAFGGQKANDRSPGGIGSREKAETRDTYTLENDGSRAEGQPQRLFSSTSQWFSGSMLVFSGLTMWYLS